MGKKLNLLYFKIWAKNLVVPKLYCEISKFFKF